MLVSQHSTDNFAMQYVHALDTADFKVMPGVPVF